MMNPYLHQMYTPPMYSAQFGKSRQSISLVSPNVVHSRSLYANKMPPPINLPKPIISTAINGYQSASARLTHKPVMQSDPKSHHYSSSVLTQVQGSYEIETSEAQQIQIVLGFEEGKQCAVVQRVCSTAEPIWDKLIYEDDLRLTLCSLNGYVEAVTLKGLIMKESLIWLTNYGTRLVWRRTGVVLCKPSTMTFSISRRNSCRSELSGTSLKTSKIDSPFVAVSTNFGKHSRSSSEQSKIGAVNTTADNTSAKSLQSYSGLSSQRLSDDELCEIFKAHCNKHPILLQNVLQWGISRMKNMRVDETEVLQIASGRVWVTVKLAPIFNNEIDSWQKDLDELKGAYQEVTPSVYMQPAPEADEPGKQHRLQRNSIGSWMIEEYNSKQKNWRPCAQKLPYGYWVDLRVSRKMYIVKIVPMLDILRRMKNECKDFEEMKKNVEFLFSSCNQKKLNTKLKPRNLRHNIVSLRLKLEKQYDLSFAVRVASIADSLALEGKKLCLKDNKSSS